MAYPTPHPSPRSLHLLLTSLTDQFSRTRTERNEQPQREVEHDIILEPEHERRGYPLRVRGETIQGQNLRVRVYVQTHRAEPTQHLLTCTDLSTPEDAKALSRHLRRHLNSLYARTPPEANETLPHARAFLAGMTRLALRRTPGVVVQPNGAHLFRAEGQRAAAVQVARLRALEQPGQFCATFALDAERRVAHTISPTTLEFHGPLETVAEQAAQEIRTLLGTKPRARRGLTTTQEHP